MAAWDKDPVVNDAPAGGAAPPWAADPVAGGGAPAGRAEIPGAAPGDPAAPQAVRPMGLQREPTFKEKVIGSIEAALFTLESFAGGAIGLPVGVARAAAAGEGLQPGGRGAQMVEESMAGGTRMVQQAMALSPFRLGLEAMGGGTGEQMTPTGQEYTDTIERFLGENLPAHLGMIGPAGGLAMSAAHLARLAMSAAHLARLRGGPRQLGLGVRRAAEPILEAVRRMPEPEPAAKAPQGAVGAAATDLPTQRRERAASLPVPIKLTEGQATREFGAQRFERETAKDPETGKPIRERQAQQLESVWRNFEDFVDQTGAETVDRGEVGRSVVDPLVAKAESAKAKIREAYKAAEDAGETQQPVPADRLVALLEEIDSSSTNAPVIKTAQQELVRLGGATRDADGRLVPGEITLADLEELRKTVGVHGRKDPTNAHFAGQIREAIDASTEGAGGELYQKARGLYRDYAAEFKNTAVIRDLVDLKKNSSDRRVAFEKVFDRTILRGSVEDIGKVRDALNTAGEKGQQAWRDMRGTAINWIKEQAETTGRDERGTPLISAAGLDRAISKLDRDGKLEALFGKAGAEQLRDINDIAKDLFTAPPGSVNYSTTASVLKQSMDGVITWLATGVPVPALTTLKALAKKLKQRGVEKQVAKALGKDEPLPPGKKAFVEPPAEPAPPPSAPTPTPPKGGGGAAPAANVPRGAKPLPVPETRELTGEQAAALKPTRRERELVRLREQTTDPEIRRELDADIAAEREVAAKQQRGRELLRLADEAKDPEVRAQLERRAKKLGAEREQIPAGEATELEVVDTAPAPAVAEAVPAGEARELPATDRMLERLKVSATEEAAWQRQFRLGDLDKATAQKMAEAIRIDEAAVDKIIEQYDRSPRAFERELDKLIERGKGNEGTTKQAQGGGKGLDGDPGPAEGGTPAEPRPPGPVGPSAAGADRAQAPAGGQAERGLKTVADLFRDNKGIKRADMPVIPNDLKPDFVAELKRDGINSVREEVPARSLKATQQDFNLENIEFIRGEVRAGKFKNNPIIVSADGRVVDGHHRWVGAAQDGKPIEVIRVDLPIEDLLQRAKAFQQARNVASRSADEASAKAAQFKLKPGQKPPPEREARIAEAVALADGVPKEAIDDAVKVLRQYKGPPPVDIPAKARTRLEEFIAPLIEKAKAANDGYLAQVKAIADSLGAEAKLAPVKSQKRAIEKLYLDELDSGLQAWPDSIGDLNRASIVVKSEADIPAAIAAVREKLDVVKLKDRFSEPMPTGYRDVLVSVRLPNGQKAELQIHIPEMIAAKELGHLLYEIERVVPKGEKGDLIAAQKRFYGAAYESAGAGSRQPGGQPATSPSNSRRLISAQPSQSDSARPVGTDTKPSDSVQMTGSPSRSKNLAPEGIEGASTSSILPGAPAGRTTSVTTERGMTVPVRYRVADIGQLVTSHTDDLRENPAFDQALQPRDRAKPNYKAQVAEIENDIRPEWLAESPKASDGAPIVGKGAMVESGNGRTIALRRAYANNKAAHYRAWLIENAERFGLTPDQIKGIKHPVLFRETLGDYDRQAFVHGANAPSVQAMSAGERATADAKRLPDLEGLEVDEDGNVNVSRSTDWVRAFMREVVEPTERGNLMTSDGSLSQSGEQRIRNAVFMAAYRDPALVERMAEEIDAAGKNVVNGMLRAAPAVAKLRNLADAGAREAPTWIEPLIDAVRRFRDAREAKQTVAQYLAQGDMLGGGASPETATMMQQLEAFSRAPRRLADHIRALVRESSKDPRQNELLEPRATYAAPRKLADDMAGQQQFLAQRASAAGFKSVDEWVAADLDGFMKAAQEWRQRNPAGVLNEPEPDLLSSQTPEELKAKTEREAAALKADQAEQKRLADKAKADAARPDFTLTGSDRQADANPNQATLFEPRISPQGTYQRDLFGAPVEPPPAPKPKPQMGIRSPLRPLDAPEGQYFTQTSIAEVRQQKLGAKKVRTLEDAANALAYLSDGAVERLDAILTDADGNPIAVLGGFKGNVSSTPVYLPTLLGEAVSLTDKGRLWLVHNHPSGATQLSRADEGLAFTAAEAFRGTGISVEGMVAVGPAGKWGGSVYADGFMQKESGKALPLNRADGPAVPVAERRITTHQTGRPIGSPDDAKDVAEVLMRKTEQPQIVLLNAGHEVVGIVPWRREDSAPLRENGRLGNLMRAVSKANAGAALVLMGKAGKALTEAEAQNLGAGLSLMDVRVLDVIDERMRSFAEQGRDTKAAVLRAGGAAALATALGAGMLPKDDEERTQ